MSLDPGEEIPLVKCAAETCDVALCPDGCQDLSAKCDGCDRRFCNDHLILVEPEYECECRFTGDQTDATDCLHCNPSLRPRPDRFCAACLAEVEQVNWPVVPKLEPVTAVVQMPSLPEWGDAA